MYGCHKAIAAPESRNKLAAEGRNIKPLGQFPEIMMQIQAAKTGWRPAPQTAANSGNDAWNQIDSSLLHVRPCRESQGIQGAFAALEPAVFKIVG